MSQVRESLNPGLPEEDLLSSSSGGGSGESREQHVQTGETMAAGENNASHRNQRCQSSTECGKHNIADKNDHDDEGNAGGGHDSDPPIENQNPEDGDGVFVEQKHFVEDGEEGDAEEENGNINRKRQFHHRKRKKSVHNSDVPYVPPYKKTRFRFGRQTSVLPSKFLLGGNIRDPLNLASLADAKVNAEMNKATPNSSPLVGPQHPSQVPVFIPKNPDDPLGLSTENPNDIIAGVRPGKNKKRHRRRGRKRTDSECSAATSDALEDDGTDDQEARSGVSGGRGPRKCSGMGTSFEESEDSDSIQQRNEKQQHATGVRNQNKQQQQGETLAKPDSEKEKVPAEQEKRKVDETTSSGKAAPDSKQDEDGAGAKQGQSNRRNEKDDQKQISEVVSSNEQSEKATPICNGTDEQQQSGSGTYPCKSSEYVPLSSSYAPSPYIFDSTNPEETFEVKPFESPSLTNYCCNAVTPSHLMEPFSPPPRPEIPHFQRRMQMMSSIRHRHPEVSLQRAVFQKPFYRRRFRHKSDPIVSPVIPQPGSSNRRNHHHHRHNKKNNEKPGNLNTSNTSTTSNHSSSSRKGSIAKSKQIQKNEIKSFRPKDEIYQFGNYKQYYGYRTTPDGDDSRLWILKKDWFREKDVLDIGCNIGHVTLSIARDFEARRVHGIDIDNNLITTARKNIKHYMIHDPSDKTIVFPHSLPMLFGAMQPPSGAGMAPQKFPFNVMFSQENYVLSNDSLLETVKPEYDVIICLSVTKWIHLNFGDDGMKRFFRRIFRHLRKGGKLILEPQEWSSYYKKRKLTAKISENYKNIKFTPDQFQDFLVREVGFTFIQRLGTPHHAKGFQRPILVFCKESKGDSPVTDHSNTPSIETKTPNE